MAGRERFAVYGDSGRAGYLNDLSLREREEAGTGRKFLTGEATLIIERDGGRVNLSGSQVVKDTRVWQFIGGPLAIDMAQNNAGEAMLAPLVNPDPPLTVHDIQRFLSDVNVKKLASEFEHRLLARGGAAEGSTVLERGEPRAIAHLDVDGNGLPDAIGAFSLLVERNSQCFVFDELFVRYDSGGVEAIRPFTDDQIHRDDGVVFVSFIKNNSELKTTSVLVRIFPAWTRAKTYALLTRTSSGWIRAQDRQ